MRKKNPVIEFLKIYKSIDKELDAIRETMRKSGGDNSFSLVRHELDVLEEDIKPYGKFLSQCQHTWHNGKNGYRTETATLFWQTYPCYMKGTSPEITDLFLNHSQRIKKLYTHENLEFGLWRKDYRLPTDTHWGLRFEQELYTVWENGEVIFTCKRPIHLKQWYEERVNPKVEIEKTFEESLADLGIEVTIIPHDINEKINHFNPLNYVPKGFTEEVQCNIIKISFPNKNVVEFDEVKEHFDGVTPHRCKHDGWKTSPQPNHNNYDAEGFIKLDDGYYEEEVVWYFHYGNNPSVQDVFTSLFYDFDILEQAFFEKHLGKAHSESVFIDQNSLDDTITLYKALEFETIDIKEVKSTMDTWYRIGKLYNRLRVGEKGGYSQHNDGMGIERYYAFEELVKNI